jgi:hypothetical protein
VTEKEVLEQTLQEETRMLQRQQLLKQLWKLNRRERTSYSERKRISPSASVQKNKREGQGLQRLTP